MIDWFCSIIVLSLKQRNTKQPTDNEYSNKGKVECKEIKKKWIEEIKEKWNKEIKEKWIEEIKEKWNKEIKKEWIEEIKWKCNN